LYLQAEHVATIPADKIAEVRDRVDIEQVIGRSVPLKRQGRRLLGRCPFHKEKTPSFSVDPGNKLYHCFGCHVGGDVIDFVMRIESIEFPEAVRMLAREFRVEIVEEEESPEAVRARRERDKLFELNRIARGFFERTLWQDERALCYLRDERKLTEDTIRRFHIGFAPDAWDRLVAELDKAGADLELAVKVGLIAKRREGNGHYDRLRARIIFPITVPGGEVAGFGARRVDWIEKAGEEQGPKYLNSPESPVYDKSSILYGLAEAKDTIRRSRRAILVEGYVDVIALHQAGVVEAIACCGTALSPRHAGLLRKLAEEVVTLYDGDAAGAAATRRAAEALLVQGLSVHVAKLPDGEDPDTYVQKEGAPVLEKRLASAPSAIDAVVAEARTTYQGGGLAGLVKIVEAVRPLLLSVKDPLARDVYIEGAAKHLGIDGRMLRQHLGGKPLQVAPRPESTQAARQVPAPSKAPERRPQVEAGPPKVELAVLKLLVEQPGITAQALEAEDVLAAFTHPALKAAIEVGREAVRQGVPFGAHRAIEAAQASGAGEATMRALRETLMQALPEQEPLEVCIEHLLLNYYQHRLRELRGQKSESSDPEAAARVDAELADVVRAKAELVKRRSAAQLQKRA
jgi:DNA primase